MDVGLWTNKSSCSFSDPSCSTPENLEVFIRPECGSAANRSANMFIRSHRDNLGCLLRDSITENTAVRESEFFWYKPSEHLAAQGQPDTLTTGSIYDPATVGAVWQLPVGWAMGKKIRTILPPLCPAHLQHRGFYCCCPSAQEGLGMLPKKGREEMVMTLMKSENSNKPQGSRDNSVFIKPMSCSQYQAPWHEENTKSAEVSTAV